MPRNPAVLSRYRQALLSARQRGLLRSAQVDRRLVSSMERALLEITKDVDLGKITAARGQALKGQIRGVLGEFSGSFASLADQAARVTAADVARIHRAVNRSLFEEAGIPFSRSIEARFDVVPTRALESLLSRVENAGTFQTVARRKLSAVVPELDAIIDGAVARGLSAGRATLDVASVLANGNPTLLARLPPGISGQLHRGVGQIDLSRYGLSEAEVLEARSLLYDSRRIAVSETNNTLREANAKSMVASPIVTAAKWQPSGRHKHTDACDAFAQLDLYGLGGGIHPVDRWPLAPHPHCACCQGGPVQYRPVSEWGKPKPAGPHAIHDGSDPKLYPAAWKDGWTPRQFERVRETVSRGVRSVNPQPQAGIPGVPRVDPKAADYRGRNPLLSADDPEIERLRKAGPRFHTPQDVENQIRAVYDRKKLFFDLEGKPFYAEQADYAAKLGRVRYEAARLRGLSHLDAVDDAFHSINDYFGAPPAVAAERAALHVVPPAPGTGAVTTAGVRPTRAGPAIPTPPTAPPALAAATRTAKETAERLRTLLEDSRANGREAVDRLAETMGSPRQVRVEMHSRTLGADTLAETFADGRMVVGGKVSRQLETLFEELELGVPLSQMSEQARQGYKMMLHEVEHTLSPMRWDDYLTPAGHFFEEGLVERRAQDLAKRTFGKSVTGSGRIYNTEVTGLRFLESKAGPEAVEEIWRARTAAQRVAIANSHLDSWFHSRLRDEFGDSAAETLMGRVRAKGQLWTVLNGPVQSKYTARAMLEGMGITP